MIRRTWIGQHAMRGRSGTALKRPFPDEAAAQVEADKLNASEDPGNPLRPYPCGWTDGRVWRDTADHWHNGRDRAKRADGVE